MQKTVRRGPDRASHRAAEVALVRKARAVGRKRETLTRGDPGNRMAQHGAASEQARRYPEPVPEGACEMCAMYARRACKHIDARTRRIVHQVLARTNQP